MIKPGFSLDWLKKKDKSERPKQRVAFYTTRPEIIGNKVKKIRKLFWEPKIQPRPFRAVSGPMFKVGLGVILILLIYVLLGSQLLVLNKLEIKGNHLVTVADIEKAVFKNGFKPINALIFNDDKARIQILTMPQIKTVRFSKQILSKKLLITVEEHETTIIWQTNNQRFMVNRFGVVYDIAPDNSPLAIVEDLKNVPINLNQKILTTDFIEFVTSIVANLPRKTNLVARRIMVPETTFEIEVLTSEGWTIILDTTRSSETQLNNLVRVLKANVGNPPRQYVDLRIEDRIYYR
jgi:cell division septal protein FtsQ